MKKREHADVSIEPVNQRLERCSRCGKLHTPIGIYPLCLDCVGDFSEWRRNKVDDKFNKLHGDVKFSWIDTAQLRVKIGRSITVDVWLEEMKGTQ